MRSSTEPAVSMQMYRIHAERLYKGLNDEKERNKLSIGEVDAANSDTEVTAERNELMLSLQNYKVFRRDV